MFSLCSLSFFFCFCFVYWCNFFGFNFIIQFFFLLWHNDGPPTHVVVSFVCYFVVCLFVLCLCLCSRHVSPQTVSVWSLWCRSHSIPTSGISLRWSDLLYVMSSLNPSGSPSCLDKSYVPVTNTNPILSRSWLTRVLTLHAIFIIFKECCFLKLTSVWEMYDGSNYTLMFFSEKERMIKDLRGKKDVWGYRFIPFLAETKMRNLA